MTSMKVTTLSLIFFVKFTYGTTNSEQRWVPAKVSSNIYDDTFVRQEVHYVESIVLCSGLATSFDWAYTSCYSAPQKKCSVFGIGSYTLGHTTRAPHDPTRETCFTYEQNYVTCPSNFHEISLGCIHTTPGKYSNEGAAAAHCKSIGSSLLSVRSEAEYVELQSIFQTLPQFPPYPWVNLMKNADGAWIWVGTGVELSASSDLWTDNGPNNSNYCGYIRSGSGYKLTTYRCSEPDYIVCYIRV